MLRLIRRELMTIFILDKVDFKESNTSKDKGSFPNDEQLINQKTIMLLNIYARNNRTSTYMKQKLIK